MTPQETFEQVVNILRPYVKHAGVLAAIRPETEILKDLGVNSARLVDIVLGIEDTFDIEVADEEVDEVVTVGDAVKLVLEKTRH